MFHHFNFNIGTNKLNFSPWASLASVNMPANVSYGWRRSFCIVFNLKLPSLDIRFVNKIGILHSKIHSTERQLISKKFLSRINNSLFFFVKLAPHQRAVERQMQFLWKFHRKMSNNFEFQSFDSL